MHATFLDTKRLFLHPANLELAAADLDDPVRFAQLLRAEVPKSWPPELYDLDARRWVVRSIEADPTGFLTYYFLAKRDRREPILIGIGGYTGRPQDGLTEIGYSIVPEWQGRGLGTEVIDALTRCAFAQRGARTVCAHTLADLAASRRVLEKNGFAQRGVPAQAGTIRYEISRDEWQQHSQQNGKLG